MAVSTERWQRSYWMDSTSGEDPPSSSLPDDPVDVAVVGAGIVGLTTALRLADQGLSVALLERDRVAGEPPATRRPRSRRFTARRITGSSPTRARRRQGLRRRQPMGRGRGGTARCRGRLRLGLSARIHLYQRSRPARGDRARGGRGQRGRAPRHARVRRRRPPVSSVGRGETGRSGDVPSSPLQPRDHSSPHLSGRDGEHGVPGARGQQQWAARDEPGHRPRRRRRPRHPPPSPQPGRTLRSHPAKHLVRHGGDDRG